MLRSDRFIVERRLGQGSMGAVYLAHDHELNRKVAIKSLRRVDPSSIYLFKREFRALADLNHPNLVRLYELFSQDDEWFFTMEYISGRDFLSYVLAGCAMGGETHTSNLPRPGSTSPAADLHEETMVPGMEMLFPTPLHSVDRLRNVMQQITAGVMAVHAAGKLHRDLKSDNVMVTDEGRAVVLDFSVVVERNWDAHRTVESLVLGTPAYMSPEQASGDEIDEASDWYALGVMLYEALTGSLPFDGSYEDIVQLKRSTVPTAPSQVVHGVPAEFEDLCMSLLQRDPRLRPDGPSILRALTTRPPPATLEAAPSTTGATFVGRHIQLTQLYDALTATDTGRAAVRFVSGPSGIGKTTVVERFLHTAQQGEDAVVLKGRCYERESLPFKATDNLIDTLSRYLRRLPAAQVAALLPRDAEALTQLFPVLRRVKALAAERPRRKAPGDPQLLRTRAFAALRELLCRLADRAPLVLFIDDLQWGDVDSAELLQTVVGGEDAPALLLICAHRAGEEETSPCLKSLYRLCQDPKVDALQLRVEGLNRVECARLSRQLSPTPLPDATVEALRHEADGNPYLLSELLQYVGRHGYQAGAATVDALLHERIEELSPHASTLLQLVSVAGRPVPEEVLVLATTFDIHLDEALAELRSRKLVRGVSLRRQRAVVTYHDRIRQAVLSSMPAYELQTWNRRLATTLEASGSSDLEALVEHLLGADDRPRAGLYAQRAAQAAAEALAFDKAARLYAIAAQHAALTTEQRNELMFQWAEALVGAGRCADAVERYFEAARTAPDTLADELRKRAGIQLLAAGDMQRGRDVLDHALSEIGVDLGQSREAAIMQALQLREAIHQRGLGVQLRLEHELPEATRQPLDLLWSVAQALLMQESARALPLVHRFALQALDAGEAGRIVTALSLLDLLLELKLPGAQGPAVDGLQVIAQLQQTAGNPESGAYLELARSMRALSSQDVHEAVEQLRNTERHFRQAPTAATVGARLCRFILAGVQCATGHGGDFRHVEVWTVEAGAGGDQVLSARLGLLSAYNALVQDAPSEARTRCYRNLDLCGEDEVARTAGWLMRAAIALYAGDYGECQALIGQFDRDISASLLYSVRFFAVHGHISCARLHIRGALTDQEGHLALAEQHLKRAAEIGVRSLEPLLNIAQASLAAAAHEDERAIALLDRVMDSRSDHVRATASYARERITRLRNPGRASREAEIALRQLGVQCPDHFVQMFFPVEFARLSLIPQRPSS